MLSSYRTSDQRTREIIRSLYQQHAYLPDPHGAVGFDALADWIHRHPGQKGIVLETAHPIKFLDVVEPVIGQPVPVPASIEETLTKTKNATQIAADYSILKDYLVNSNPF
jgi:threonine synthase